MILLFIFGVSLIQIGLYYLNDKYKTGIPNFLILLVLLLGNFFVFPKLFYPEPRTDGIHCGMPILGILFAFWTFGTITLVAIHIFWRIKKNENIKNV